MRMTIPTTTRSVSRDFLLGVLPDACDGIDIDDQYQCCAYLWLCFECADCARQEFYETVADEYPGRTWTSLAARRARQDGWHIAPWSPEGVLDTTAYCPECSNKRGMRKHAASGVNHSAPHD